MHKKLKFNKDLKSYLEDTYGYQWIFKFDNGYGASVINNFMCHVDEKGLFELAVIEFDEDGDIDLCYDTEITDNVIDYLSNEEVMELLYKIKDLKKEEK